MRSQMERRQMERRHPAGESPNHSVIMGANTNKQVDIPLYAIKYLTTGILANNILDRSFHARSSES